MRFLPWLLVGALAVCTAGPACATDVPITGLKLIVVDKIAAAGKAKAVFVAKDAAVTKGTGTDPAQIAATLDVAYDAVSGSFDMLQGMNWLVNSTSVAKYVNKTAPTGGATKVSVIKPAVLVKVVGKSLGDTPLDISSPPTGTVYVADTIVNSGDETRLCTQFTGCVHKLIAGDTGYKLICKGSSTGDPSCTAAEPPTSTTVTSTTPTTITTSTTNTTTTIPQCVDNTDCDFPTFPTCTSGVCGPCTSDLDCVADDPSLPTCNVDTGECQATTTTVISSTTSTTTIPQCVDNTDCDFPTLPTCTSGVCGPCTSDLDCVVDDPSLPTCDVETGQCG